MNYYLTVALTFTDLEPTLIVTAFFLAFLAPFRVRVALPLANLTSVSLTILPFTVIVSANAFFLFWTLDALITNLVVLPFLTVMAFLAALTFLAELRT